MSTNYQVGDVVFNTWGWEQTNIDFYQVVKVSAATISIKPIQARIVKSSPLAMHGHTMPVVDSFKSDETAIKRPNKHGNVKFKYGAGRKWDGMPVGCSWYA